MLCPNTRPSLLGKPLALLGGVCTLAILLPVGAQEGRTEKPASQPSRVPFRKVVINANSDFEAASAADINRDGKLDIVSGDTWYEAPDWTPHKFREIGVWGRGPGSSGYRASFAELPIDVNGDGWVDIVSSDYASAEIFWHENPGKKGGEWKRHLIAKPGSAETTAIAPILGKKTICILPNCGNQVVWYELQKGEWREHFVGKEGAAHGIGWGDVNRDGKTDLITPHGWYENVDARNNRWVWHKDWECRPGDLGIGTPTFDVDGDGRNDIVFGSGHNYGLYWLQQMPPNSPQKWVQHPIDTSWSQAHTLVLTTLEGNGTPVVLTGKRYKAHDHDPGADEAMCLYYYKYSRKAKRWEKFVIDEGTQVGTGLQLTAVDLRGTGKLDIIAPGKSGLYLFLNESE